MGRHTIVGPGEGATVQGPAGGPLTFKARGEQTDGALTVFENVIAPGDGPPMHFHEQEDESWYVLEGELRFKIDGELSRAPAGSFVFVPRGMPHCFQGVAEGSTRILVIFNPSGNALIESGDMLIAIGRSESLAKLKVQAQRTT